MEVIGAINLYNSECIDTLEPDYNIIQDCKPINLAIKWNNIGINWIHLVDVNGFRERKPINIEIIKSIISKVNVPIEVASGIEDIESFEDMLAAGADRIVLDNKVLANTEFIKRVLQEYPEKTVILFNVNSGMVEVDGNYQDNISDIVKNLEKQGLRRIIYRDASANYKFNYEDLAALAGNITVPIITCGKLNDMESIKKLKEIAECENVDIEGMILSKPLYDNSLDLFEVIKLIEAYPYVGDFYSREDIC